MLFILAQMMLAIVISLHVSHVNCRFFQCQVTGDPRIMRFANVEGEVSSFVACPLPTTHTVLFGTTRTNVTIVNAGGLYGDIVNFHVRLSEQSTSIGDVCTYDPTSFNLAPRSLQCGTVSISIDHTEISIGYPLGVVTIKILKLGSRYDITVWACNSTAASSIGLCRAGCNYLGARSNSLTPMARTSSKNPSLAALAEQVCDLYLKNFLLANLQTYAKLQKFVESARQGCMTDVTVMGDKTYAKQTLTDVATTFLTYSANTAEHIHNGIAEATKIVEKLAGIVDHDAEKLIMKIKALG